MSLIDELMHTGKDLITALGGSEGAEKLLSLLEADAHDPKDTTVVDSPVDAFLGASRVILESKSPSDRDEIGHGLLAYLRGFQHVDADHAATLARGNGLTSVDSVLAVFQGVLKVNPAFFADVVRYFVKGAPMEATNDAGPASWLLSLLKTPVVCAFFKELVESGSSRIIQHRLNMH